MVTKIRLWPEPPARQDARVVLTCRIEGPPDWPSSLWYAVDADAHPWLSARADPWLLSALLAAMRTGLPLAVQGPVSRSLLANLDLLQRLWVRWLPHAYRRVDMACDVAADAPPVGTEALLAFSGGVDSAFSAYRGAKDGGRAKLAAGLTVHGFDVPVDDARHFPAVRAKTARLLGSLGLEALTIATNVRALPGDWNHAHGAATAAALHWFSGRFGAGVIASTLMYDRIDRPYGSQLLTDSLLGSLSFPILHDGAEVARIDKVDALAAWPEAMAALRVCWMGARGDDNCGVCDKCLRTKLEFLVNGRGLPLSLPGVPTADEIRAWPMKEPWQLRELDRLIARAELNSLTRATWFAPLVARRDRSRRDARRRAIVARARRLGRVAAPWRWRRR